MLARERDNGDAADGKGVPEYAVSVARRPESLLRAHAAFAEGIDVAVPPRWSPHGGYAGRVIGGRETIIVLVAAAAVKKRQWGGRAAGAHAAAATRKTHLPTDTMYGTREPTCAIIAIQLSQRKIAPFA